MGYNFREKVRSMFESGSLGPLEKYVHTPGGELVLHDDRGLKLAALKFIYVHNLHERAGIRNGCLAVPNMVVDIVNTFVNSHHVYLTKSDKSYSRLGGIPRSEIATLQRTWTEDLRSREIENPEVFKKHLSTLIDIYQVEIDNFLESVGNSVDVKI